MRRAWFQSIALALAAACASTSSPAERVRWWGNERLGVFFAWEPFPAAEAGDSVPDPSGFDPIGFDADRWISLAEEAGAGFVLTSTTSRTGFPLFDAEGDGPDATSSAFGRDPLAELAEACQRRALRFGWKHAPTARGEDGVDEALSAIARLVTEYGAVDLLWFDGTRAGWTRVEQREIGSLLQGLGAETALGGVDLDPGGGGVSFEVRPPSVLEGPPPRRPWAALLELRGPDDTWRSVEEVVSAVAEAASRGGNLVLAVRPTPLGEIPEPARRLLTGVGRWMTLHAEAVNGASAAPFERLDFGWSTARRLPRSHRLYLFVRDWPENGALFLPGLATEPAGARLAGSGRWLDVERVRGDFRVALPDTRPATPLPVVVVELDARPTVYRTPRIEARGPRFVGSTIVRIEPREEDVTLRYTLDGGELEPSSTLYEGPFELTQTATVSVASFVGVRQASTVARRAFERVELSPALEVTDVEPGLEVELYLGVRAARANVDGVLPTRVQRAPTAALGVVPEEPFTARAQGLLRVAADDVYSFSTFEGARLFVAERPIPPGHRGLALEAGWHPLRVEWSRGADPGLAVAPLGTEPREPRSADLATGALR